MRFRALAIALATALTLLLPTPAFAGRPEVVPDPGSASPNVEDPGGGGGGIGAYAFMTYAAPALTAIGNTVGWPRGHIKISAVIYAPDATGAWSRTNDCWTATSCTLPTYASCPIKAGYWQMYVDAWSVDYPNLPMKHGSAEALVIL